MKYAMIVLYLSLGIVPALQAQQSITRFAVVDMNRVLDALGSSNQAFVEKSAAIQTEIDRLNAELQDLKAQLEEAKTENRRGRIRSLEAEIKDKVQSTQAYIQKSFAELEAEKNRTLSDELLRRLTNTLRIVAESEGYSMVLSKQDGSGILWYSPSVDITNRVLRYLRTGKLD
ncbi:MAG: OmpH family outer membrane protein [Spirochaetaceae bacterium]|jgi:outer membrane protein|nr:OmpH family outer membrane protein [Spirochaetaceae bacterium]